jgi:undecaprenyl-diphosphatase
MINLAYYGFLIYLTYKYIKNKHLKWVMIMILTVFVLTIGLSRIYLGVHYTSDVLGGFLFSIAYLLIYIKLTKKFIGKGVKKYEN